MTQQFNLPQSREGQKISLGTSRLLQRAQAKPDAPKILIEPPGFAKMSQLIVDFARPLLALDEEQEFFAESIAIASIAWNMALTLEHTPELTMEELFVDFFGVEFLEEDREELFDQIKMLMRRKQKYFSKHQRFILDYEVTESEDLLHVDIISELV